MKSGVVGKAGSQPGSRLHPLLRGSSGPWSFLAGLLRECGRVVRVGPFRPSLWPLAVPLDLCEAEAPFLHQG